MKKICVFIGSRANYASILETLHKIKINKKLKLQIVVGASALSEKFGNVSKIIKKDGFNLDGKIHSLIEGESHISMAKTIGITLNDSVTILSKLKPDICLVIGDRSEVLGFAIASVYLNIKLSHTMGGELSGTIDESARHAISKLAHIHFTASSSATRRLLSMGENKKNIYQTGCPRIDRVKNILKNKLILDKKIRKELKSGVGEKLIDINNDFILTSFHPVTTETNNYLNAEILLKTLIKINLPTIILWPNADGGSNIISKCYRKYREKKLTKNISFYKNFSFESYIYLMKKTKLIIGNSSSGIREASFIGTKCINIGSRQNDRDRGSNIIDIEKLHSVDELFKIIKKNLNKNNKKISKIYGDGNASKKIISVLIKEKTDLQKKWFEN